MFKAATKYADVEINEENNYYTVPETDDVLTENGWKKVKELSVGDIKIRLMKSVFVTGSTKSDVSILLYDTPKKDILYMVKKVYVKLSN